MVQEGRGVIAVAVDIAASFTSAMNSITKPVIDREWVLVGWHPPEHGWVNLNLDGAVKGNDFKASSGGVLRGSYREGLGGFAQNISTCSVMRGELWGVLDGLNLAWEKGFRQVIIEVDILFVIEAIKKRELQRSNYHNLVMSIQRLLSLDWTIVLKHV